MYPQYTESGFDIRGLDWARLIEEQEDYLMELLSKNITTEKTHRELVQILIKINLRDEIKIVGRQTVIQDFRKNSLTNNPRFNLGEFDREKINKIFPTY